MASIPVTVFSLAVLLLGVPLPCKGQEIVSEPVTHTVVRGSSVSLPCRVKGLGGNNVVWLHGFRVLTMNQMTLVSNPRLSVVRDKMADNVYKYDLQITDIKGADNGTYKCQVTSDVMVEQTSVLFVQVPAEITDVTPAGDVTYKLGDNVTLKCSATGTPNPNITWSKEGSDEEHSGDMLEMTSLGAEDGGVYTCTASNGVGQPDSDSVRLSVVYAPIIHPGPNVVRTGPGHVAVLPCVVSGLPPPTVTWRHNGSEVDVRALPQHREIEHSAQGAHHSYALRITGVRDQDLGQYECTVTNDLGTAATSVSLAARPGRVNIVSYENGAFSTQYALRWNVSAVVPPTHYTLTLEQLVNSSYAQDMGSRDFRAPSSPEDAEYHVHSYDVTGLAPQTTYRVTLTAHNRYGAGVSSRPFVFRTNKAGFSPPPPTQPPADLETLAPRDLRPKDEGKSGAVTLANSLLLLPVAMFALQRHVV